MVIRTIEEEQTISISTSEYKTLVEDSVNLKTIINLIEHNKYLVIEDVLLIAGKKVKKTEEEADGRD